MNHVVRVTEFRQRFKTMLDRVSRDKQALIVTRNHRPEVVLIPYEEFVRFQQFQETEVSDHFDRLLEKMAELNAAYSELEADLRAAEDEGQGRA